MTEPPVYQPGDHYWIVAGDETGLWSSAAGAYVEPDDAAYGAWRDAGGAPTPIASEAELDGVLIAAGCGDRAPHPQILIPYGVFRSRWEPAELEALFEARKVHWQVDDIVSLAQAQNGVNLTGPMASAAKALFVQLGVLTAERADAIFAPTA